MIEFSQILAVVAVFALLGGALFALRSHGLAGFRHKLVGANERRRMEVLERLPLSPAHSLQIVRVEDKLLLVSIAPQACLLVLELGDPVRRDLK